MDRYQVLYESGPDSLTEAVFGIRDADHLEKYPNDKNRTADADGFLVIDPKVNIANGNPHPITCNQRRLY